MILNLKDYKVLLASKSPRRQELLKSIGVDFEIAVKDNVDESFPRSIDPQDVAEYLSQKKMNAYSNLLAGNNLVITADTLVILENRILGKPEDRKDAMRMLKSLSEHTHTVITGVCIGTEEKQVSFSSSTKVKFNQLSKDEISYYIDNYSPYDKAGSYGIQEWIGYIGIRKINGCFYNVMGLPLSKLYEVLKEF